MIQLTFAIYLGAGEGAQDLQNQSHDFLHMLTECIEPSIGIQQNPSFEIRKELTSAIQADPLEKTNLNFKRN